MWLPMVEKARHELRCIERSILMDSPRTEPQRRELGRGDRACGEQEGQRRALLGKRCDQRKHRIRFAHAGGMEPSEPSRRPLDGWLPQSFMASQRLFLAAPRAQ